ncbi:unnamed protein product, partial [Prorocentrum cordatum]
SAQVRGPATRPGGATPRVRASSPLCAAAAPPPATGDAGRRARGRPGTLQADGPRVWESFWLVMPSARLPEAPSAATLLGARCWCTHWHRGGGGALSDGDGGRGAEAGDVPR